MILMPEGLKKFRCKQSNALIRDACFHSEEIGSVAFAGAAALDRAEYVCECFNWYLHVLDYSFSIGIGNKVPDELPEILNDALFKSKEALAFQQSFN